MDQRVARRKLGASKTKQRKQEPLLGALEELQPVDDSLAVSLRLAQSRQVVLDQGRRRFRNIGGYAAIR